MAEQGTCSLCLEVCSSPTSCGCQHGRFHLGCAEALKIRGSSTCKVCMRTYDFDVCTDTSFCRCTWEGGPRYLPSRLRVRPSALSLQRSVKSRHHRTQQRKGLNGAPGGCILVGAADSLQGGKRIIPGGVVGFQHNHADDRFLREPRNVRRRHSAAAAAGDRRC